MRLKVCICSVLRRGEYVHGTIASLKKTGFFDVPEMMPLRISVGHPEASYLDRYRANPSIELSKQTPEEERQVNYHKLNIRQRSTWGHLRAMQVMQHHKSEWDAVVILEDDVLFAKGWIPYLGRILEEISERYKEGWILSLFQFTHHIKRAFAEGKRYTSVPWNLFNGAPCFIYPHSVLSRLMEYMMENGIRHYRQVNDFSVRDFARENKVPILASVPCLIEHIGDNSTGQSDPGKKYRADLFMESVEHLNALDGDKLE